jgi:hypothetical protein
MARYIPTIKIDLDNLQRYNLQAGQWLSCRRTGSRGQFLGITKAGTIAIRWQNGRFGKWQDLTNNKHIREYAKFNGSK